jgi:galactokinase
VVSENARVLAAIDANATDFGTLMNASHASLRDDYAVSVPAMDELVAVLQNHSDVFGARLTGAGFSGCCVALVAAGRAAAIGSKMPHKNLLNSGPRLLYLRSARRYRPGCSRADTVPCRN